MLPGGPGNICVAPPTASTYMCLTYASRGWEVQPFASQQEPELTMFKAAASRKDSHLSFVHCEVPKTWASQGPGKIRISSSCWPPDGLARLQVASLVSLSLHQS
jgi:hypothetical protein